MYRDMKHWVRASLVLPVLSAFWTTLALAQQGGTDPGTATSTTTTTTEVWYGNWWVWAIVVGVFLIVVIALTSRGRSA